MNHITAVLTLAWFACTAPALHAKLNVVATLPDIAAIATAVGGDHIKVTSLARGTEDPHFVDPKPSFVRLLNQADLLIEGGADLEAGWLPPLVNGARNKKILPGNPGRLALAPGLRLLEVPAAPVDRSQGDVHPAGNPHFLLDPLNGQLAAMRIASALAQLDAAHGEAFTANARRFGEQLEQQLAGWRAALAPYRGAKVVTYHKTYSYLLDRFGFVLVGTVEPKPGLEPSPTHIHELVSKMKAEGVKLVLIEPNRPRKTPEIIAEQSGAKLVLLPATVGASDRAADYLALFDSIIAQLTQALK